MNDGLQFSPHPWQIDRGEGSFPINANVRILVGANSGRDTHRSAESLKSALIDLFDLDLRVVPTADLSQAGHIALAIGGREDVPDHESPVQLGPQGYTLRIDGTAVAIIGNDEAGLFYGVQTLIQIARAQGRRWPALKIADRPAVLNRGYLLDITRGKVHTPETLASLVRTFAHFKCNHLQLYTEHAFDFPSAPEIGAGTGALTPEDILRLDVLCRDHHIELAANFQSLGHQGRLLKLPEYEHLAETRWRFTFATDNDEVFAFLDQLFGDLLPCFSSRLLNVNADEPWDIGRGVSSAMSAKIGYGGVFLHHLRRLHELTTKHGRRMAMWADVLKHYPDLMADLPDDILLIDWWYEATERYESLDALSKSGREFWICAATSSWMALYPRLENAIRNIREYTQQGIAAGATGVLVSDWGDSGHDQLITSSIYPLIWGAECAWAGGTTSSDDFDAAFGIHVLNDRSGALVAALRRLGAAMQTERQWLTTWHSAMALYEDPLVGKIAEVASPEVVAEAQSAAVAIQSLLSQISDPMMRADLGFLTWQIQFACDKVETTRSVRAALEALAGGTETDVRRLDEAIEGLVRLQSVLPAMVEEFEHRWLASARPSSIQFNLDRYSALNAQFDRSIAWLTVQRDAFGRGDSIAAALSSYGTGGYAVLHEATYIWVKELEGIVGYDALPDDIKEYLRDVGGT